MSGAGLPHSETPGSKPVCGSPRLIAACRVLRRLPVPRHPSCALSSLTTKKKKCFRILDNALPELAGLPPILQIVKDHAAWEPRIIFMVGVPGLEPGTSSLSGTRSNHLSYTPGNDSRPRRPGGVELKGVEPLTSSLQSWRSGQLSYSPVGRCVQA